MGPLDGVKIIELAGLAPGPFGCMLLADLGAEVLRVERRAATSAGGVTAPEGPLDRGKRSITLDLKRSEDRDFLVHVATTADVFVEGFRPGAAERLRIGPDDLRRDNPHLIYGRITGWGQDGPLASTAGHDINYIALSGVLGLIGREGEPPVPPANIIGDFAGGGMLLALGVIAALFERGKSGQGQVVDAAMIDGAGLFTAFMHGMRAAGRWNEPRGMNTLDGAAPFYDTYECADGEYVAVGCVEPQFYRQLLATLDLDEGKLPSQQDRAAWPILRGVLADKFKSLTRNQWSEIFADSDACVTPVLSPWEAHAHPHNAYRLSHLDIGGVTQPAPAPRFSRTPLPAPAAHTSGAKPVREMLSRWGVEQMPSDL